MSKQLSKWQCRAIAEKTSGQCKNKRLRWSKYCWVHQSKTFVALTLIIGSILGYIVPLGIELLFPPKNELRRDEAILRITSEAATIIKDTDMVLMQYLSRTDNISIWEKLNTIAYWMLIQCGILI